MLSVQVCRLSACWWYLRASGHAEPDDRLPFCRFTGHMPGSGCTSINGRSRISHAPTSCPPPKGRHSAAVPGHAGTVCRNTKLTAQHGLRRYSAQPGPLRHSQHLSLLFMTALLAICMQFNSSTGHDIRTAPSPRFDSFSSQLLVTGDNASPAVGPPKAQ